MTTTTPNTTASGAAEAGLHALADRIEEAQGRAICISVESANYLRKALAASAPAPPTMVDMVPPATSRDRWMYEQGRLAERDPRTSKAAPAPQPAPMPYPTDAQIGAVYEQTMGQHLRSQDAPAVRRFGRAMFLCAWNAATEAAPVAPAPQPAINPRTQYLTVVYRGVEAGDEARVICDHPKVSAVSWSHALDDRDAALAAAPKAAPAINKVSDIIDAYGMTPGQPERVADIPGLAEALEAAFADGSAQITGALQQGEYLPLPEPDTHCCDDDTGIDVWSHSADLVRAYGEANWKAGYKQGALADAAPDNRVPEAWTNLLAYALQDDVHNQLTPRVVDIAYTAFMQAKRPNDEDGGASDWFNDTKPKVAEMIAKLRKDLIEELAAQPAPVAEGFDEWLEKQFEFRNYYYNPRGPGLMAVPFARRAYEAGRAQAAQPEGGA